MSWPVDPLPVPQNVSLIVCWNDDAGRLGRQVAEYLNRNIGGRSFSGIEPERYFTLDGVTIDSNVARMPESNFYAGERHDLAVFASDQPHREKYAFLNAVLDGGGRRNVKELYTVNGNIASITHASPRRLMAAYNQPDLQGSLRRLGLADLSWEGPPAASSYLLWLSQRRNIPAVGLLSEVAFYLAAVEDPAAVRSVLSFLNDRFGLGMDFKDLDDRISRQSDRLASLRSRDPEIDRYMRTLEVGLNLNEEEQLRLARGVTEFLERGSP